MKRVLIALAVLLLPSAAKATTREDVAKRWAPVLHQQYRDEKDLFTAYDFDGNWVGNDNEESLSACTSGKKTCSLAAKVYFTVIETSSHWFVQYLPYHPVDAKVTNGHEHDTESVFLVVSKDGGGTGKLVAMETRFHLDWFTYGDGAVLKAGAKSVDGPIHVDANGRPQVYVQQAGHGFCGGYSPPNDLFPDLQLTCNHDEEPHLSGTGVVYRPDVAAAKPLVQDNQVIDAGYALEEIYTTFWAHRTEVGKGKAFKQAVDYTGSRCATLACPKQFGGAFDGDEGESPSGPWNQESGPGVDGNGGQFFDPAFTMSKRLTFPQPYSLDYCHNPYVGIVDACAKDAPPDPSGSQAPASTGPTTASSPTPSSSTDPTAPSDDASDSGCACTVGRHSATSWSLVIAATVLPLIAVRRRRRR